ncbi:hypothetical protein [uncultured Tateyamaria sp.]|uniref:hypothetical protein n=1 Tax=Tateyamaria sp. 1078 TaxID=3417464 RepID=UPI002617AFE1|nr:hypothetical protein [uncultured Tateyamaria sp.]
MIGVILWSDPTEKKAVIWCEDHGDLAFLSRPDAIELPDAFVDVGDVVEFDLRTKRSTRQVENVKILSEARAAPLVEELRTTQSAVPAAHLHQTAEVIPFRLDAPVRRAAQSTPKVQRQG